MKTQNLLKSIFSVAFIAALLPLMSCDSAGNLSGRWVRVPDGGLVIELLDDGTGIFGEGTAITWKADNGRLYLSDKSGTNGFDYKVKGSVLTIEESTEYAKCKKDCKEAVAEYAKAKFAKVKKGSFSDSRNGKKYKTVKIGKQTWMAENLNINAKGSVCYDNDPANCQKYGRLYNWETALTACPKGWHLPSDEEWGTLVDFAGGDKKAGNILKSSVGWAEEGNGIDAAGFSALPGGFGNSVGLFYEVGNVGDWWSATENNASYAYNRDMYHDFANVDRTTSGKANLFSVRCLQD